jgi:hypothetical protein
MTRTILRILAISGLSAILAGRELNQIVMHLNANRMPVFSSGCDDLPGWPLDPQHACASGATVLAGLADWMHIGDYIYSPGDIFLAAGQLLCLGAIGAIILLLCIRVGK